MVRKTLYYLEVAALAAVQVAGLASLGWAAAAAMASASAVPEVSEVALGDPTIVQDFMAALPPSDPIPRVYSWRAPMSGQIASGDRPEQDAYYHHRADVTAHRFLTDRWRGGGAMKTILRQAISGFSTECAAKGGHLEPHDTDLYSRTLSEYRPRLSDLRFEVCMRDPTFALGALLIASNKASFHDRDSHAIITYHPRTVVTQAVLDRRSAEATAARNRQAAEQARIAELERNEVDQWRRTIKPGTETGCGPVLRVNGDLIEVVYYQTREPKWYRRSELWPTLFNKEGQHTCQ